MLHPSNILEWTDEELATLTASLKTRYIGKQIHLLPSTPSTNDVAKDLARGGEADGAVIIAAVQTQGRGRLGRHWHSPIGGLWMSIIFAPEQWDLNPALMALLSAAPIARAVEEATGLDVQIKWANDLRVAQRKVGGILGEVQLLPGAPALILGIGLNVNIKSEDLPLSLRPTSISLSQALSAEVDTTALLRGLLLQLDRFWGDCRAARADLWVQEYRRRCVSLGQTITAKTSSGEVTGLALDLDASGALQVKADDGTVHSVVAGDLL